MAKMITTRGYWVDWICVFDKPPSSSGIKSAQEGMINYLRKYLAKVPTQPKNTPKGGWQEALKWDWDQISSRPLVFNFKAYFEINGKRYTAGQTKGTMTPPPPPPPPGGIPA